jgi:hypothetical protein
MVVKVNSVELAIDNQLMARHGGQGKQFRGGQIISRCLVMVAKVTV